MYIYIYIIICMYTILYIYMCVCESEERGRETCRERMLEVCSLSTSNASVLDPSSGTFHTFRGVRVWGLGVYGWNFFSI